MEYHRDVESPGMEIHTVSDLRHMQAFWSAKRPSNYSTNDDRNRSWQDFLRPQTH